MKNNKANTLINFQSKNSCKNNDEITKFNDLYLSKITNIINKIRQSIPVSYLKKEEFLYIFENFEQIVSLFKEILQEYSCLQKNIFQYESMLLRDEQTIRILYKKILTSILNKESLECRIKYLLVKEKEYELVKERTGANVYNGEFIYNEHKDNEIFILKEENSNLKKIISGYEEAISNKNKEIYDLIIKISKLKKENQNLKANISNNKVIRIPNVNIDLGDKNSDFNINCDNSNYNIIKNNNVKNKNHNNNIIRTNSKINHMHCLSWNRNYVSTLNFPKLLKHKEQFTVGNTSRNKNKKILNSKTNKNIYYNYLNGSSTNSSKIKSRNLIDFNEGSGYLLLKKNKKRKFLCNNKNIFYNMDKNKIINPNSYITSKKSVFSSPKSLSSKSNSLDKNKKIKKNNSNLKNKIVKNFINSKMNESNASEVNNKTCQNIEITVRSLKISDAGAKSNKNDLEIDRNNFSINYIKNKKNNQKKGKSEKNIDINKIFNSANNLSGCVTSKNVINSENPNTERNYKFLK